ncbi:hypothetical protein GGI35DRAFT_81285 [Trichoderma velutinum]
MSATSEILTVSQSFLKAHKPRARRNSERQKPHRQNLTDIVTNGVKTNNTQTNTHPTHKPFKTAAMTQRNYVIAIIIIVLFVVLAAISFGIYKLVHGARRELTITTESSSSNSHSLAD